MHGAHPWYVLMVRMTQERRVGDLLRWRGYEEFVPTYVAMRRQGRRTRKHVRAVFPGYLFCRFDKNKRLPILTVPGVLDILGDRKGPTPVEERELEAIRKALNTPLKCEPWPFLQAGERVEIIDGPLRGVEGVLDSFSGSTRLVLAVSLLQRSLAVEVDRSSVRPLDEHRRRGVGQAVGGMNERIA